MWTAFLDIRYSSFWRRCWWITMRVMTLLNKSTTWDVGRRPWLFPRNQRQDMFVEALALNNMPDMVVLGSGSEFATNVVSIWLNNDGKNVMSFLDWNHKRSIIEIPVQPVSREVCGQHRMDGMTRSDCGLRAQVLESKGEKVTLVEPDKSPKGQPLRLQQVIHHYCIIFSASSCIVPYI